MSRKTGRKWKTDRCGRCGRAHVGYSGKLDANGVEYVACGVTGKRMNVRSEGSISQDAAGVYATEWEEDQFGGQ